MKVTIRTFESGCGDCIFLILNREDGSTYHIMIDCNVLTPTIQEYIRNDLKLRIDTLIITHVDSDHVNGITSLMRKKEFERLEIKHIFFNCFQPQTTQCVQISETTKELLKDAFKLLPPIFNEDIHKTNGIDAACLVGQLSMKPEWKSVWRKEPILAGDIIDLGEDWGRLHFLSPTQDALDKLLHVARIEYSKIIGEAPPKELFEDQDKYFELMLRIASMRSRPEKPQKTGALAITKEALEKAAANDVDETEVTEANWASLAFYWEGGDNKSRVLMMGDAVCSQVLEELKAFDNEIWFEAIKISHHGSRNNTSIAFVDKINTEHFFLTGGKKGEGPHIDALSKFILKPFADEGRIHTLHYNHTRNIQLIDDLTSDEVKPLLESYHFKLTCENIHEFTC